MSKNSIQSNVLATVGLSQPTNLTAEFIYRYYVPEESATGDTSAYRSSLEGVPRSVSLQYTLPQLSDNEEIGTRLDYAILVNEVAKVHGVEDLSNMPNTLITLQDTGLLAKATDSIERSCKLRGITGNPTDKALLLSNQLTGSVDSTVLQKLSVNFASLNVSFFMDKQEIPAEKYDNVSGFPLSALVYDKLVSDFFSSAEVDSPSRSPVAAGLISKYLVKRQLEERQKPPSISAEDYTTILSPISLFERKTSAGIVSISNKAKRVGFLVERVEELSSGKRFHKLIGIVEPTSNSFIDYKIKYGTRYSYSVKAVYLMQCPEILLRRNDSVASSVLFSSSPSNIAAVTTEENVPPPPATDVRFNYDHTRNELAVRWEFPVNRTLDINRFQVFRRRRLTDPFMLLKEFDFDIGQVKFSRNENPLTVNTVKSEFAVRRMIDYDFGRNSEYIYAVCSVDAHGMVSNYSAQYRVSFNKRKNNIEVKCVSPQNAPRPYPNLYVNVYGSLTLDSITRTGVSKITTIFDPEYLDVTDRKGNDLEMIKFDSAGAKYFINLIDTVRAEQITIPITIKDLRLR